MEIVFQPKPKGATESAARIVARVSREKSGAVPGLATGSTRIVDSIDKLVGDGSYPERLWS